MRKILVLLFCLPHLLLSTHNPSFDSRFLSDSIRSDIDKLLDYKAISDKINNKNEKAIFYQSVAFSIYQETLNFELKIKSIISQYAELIKNLEDRLDIQNTIISYNLGSPIFDDHFNIISINAKTLKTNFHFNQLESIRSQYLKLVRYHDNIIIVCENRISELLELLDKTSIDRLYNDIIIDKHILVMNFTNMSNIDKYDQLVTTLPDMIVNRYKDRKDITVLYSGSIDPDLNSSTSSSSNRFLIDGSFLIEGYSININYKIYIVDGWEVYSEQNISCDVRNTECIYDDFLWSIEQSIKPLIKSYVYDDFPSNTTKKIIDKNIKSSLKTKKNDDLFKVVLDDFVVQKDYSFDLNYKNMNMDNDSKEISHEFNLETHPNSINNRKAISDNLINIISDYLKNPYDIEIGEMNMDFNKNDNAYANLWVPVTFDINKNDFENLIKNFAYNSLDSRYNLHVYEFLYENYLFDSKAIQSFNDYKNEIFPVLFFADRDNNIQKIVIDSWDSKYDNLLFGDYDVSRVELFNQLFSVIESSNSMYLNIKEDSQIVYYKITMPVSILDNYTRLTVKIFTRSELDEYLPISELKF
tara:strand:+ start:898 stop:2649 length:1752 start_codon:yes stop_codon:yes gene_type:complete